MPRGNPYGSGQLQPGCAVVLGSISADVDIVSTYGAPARAVCVGTAGTLKIDTEGGHDAQTIPANCLATGVFHPIYVEKIYNTGTTADEVVILL